MLYSMESTWLLAVLESTTCIELESLAVGQKSTFPVNCNCVLGGGTDNCILMHAVTL